MASAGRKGGDEPAQNSRYQRALLEAAQLDKWDFDGAVCRVLALDGATLDVERVNFWELEDAPRAIRCVAGVQRSRGLSDRGQLLYESDCPAYFEALLREEVIPVDDAQHDPRTAALDRSYLVPYGIRSMLDAPIWIRGRLRGVLCHESVGVARHWTAAEGWFAAAMAQVVSTAFEIRERRITEERLATVEKTSREQLQERDDFMSVAAHELYTPLTSLQLMVQALRGEALSPATRERSHALVERQVKRLIQLVTDLLDLSRVQAGRLDLDVAETDLVEVVRDVVDRLAAVIAGAGSTLRLRLPARAVGRWDRSRLDQVVTNLLSNAAKFGAAKPIEVALEWAEGERVVLTVRDQGIGIARDRLMRIFERYGRATSPRSFGGLGLGLFIVRGIVEAHGGSVRVESRLGVGTAVTVALPVGRAA